MYGRAIHRAESDTVRVFGVAHLAAVGNVCRLYQPGPVMDAEKMFGAVSGSAKVAIPGSTPA